VADLYLRALRRHPGRLAVIDRRERLTYAALETRAAQYAQVFQANGLVRGDGLAQLTLNRIDAVAVLIAALAHGLRYTPLHPKGTLADHQFVLEDSGIRHVVIDANAFPDWLPSASGPGIGGQPGQPRTLFSFEQAPGCLSLLEARRNRPEEPLVSRAQPQDLCALFYTGGTTGRSKGAMHRHRSIIANTLIELAEFEWPEPLKFLAVTPISHAAFAFLLPVFLKGGTFVLREEFTPSGFLDAVREHRISATFLVPTQISTLLDTPGIATADTASLQLIAYGASPIAPARLAQALERFGPVFMQLYGQTEAPNAVCVLKRADHRLDGTAPLGTCGTPVAGLDVRLLDPQGVEVAPGEIGEICVRGPLVMDGYWNRPEETAASLAGGWLHTGDLARADAAGFLTIVDRTKDMIISGGFNVYPREVEDALVAHPGVSQAIVIGVPDPKWGEAVMAYVVRSPGAEVSEQALKAHVRELRGPVHAPKFIEFLDSMPLTALGKPDRKALRAPHWRDADRQVN